MFAAQRRHLHVLEYLVERGADLEARDQVNDSIVDVELHTFHTWMYQGGNTPLIYAAMYGHLPVVEYLVERGADMEAMNNASDVFALELIR